MRKSPHSATVGRANVSRETLDDLTAYVELLRKWQRKINLIAPGSLDRIWDRHITDSLQILPYMPEDAELIVDLGSGGGLPGLVVAIACKRRANAPMLRMVESDARKSAFLWEVIRVLDLRAEVLTARIEDAPPQNADVVTARALAPLPSLLGYVHRHLDPKGTAILLKGVQLAEELAAARVGWQFQHACHPSETSADGVILQIWELSNARAEPA